MDCGDDGDDRAKKKTEMTEMTELKKRRVSFQAFEPADSFENKHTPNSEILDLVPYERNNVTK